MCHLKIDVIDKTIQNNLLQILNFLQRHKKWFITSFDTGGSTVVIKKDDYTSKVINAFSSKFYEKLNYDPTKKLKQSVINFFKTIVLDGFIDKDLFQNSIGITIYNSIIACYSDLTKIRKPDLLMKIIVSTVNSPLYIFDKWLSKFLKNILSILENFLKNLYDLKNFLFKISVLSGYIFASFDIVSMFPPLPHHLIIQSIKNRWNILKHTIKLHMSLKEFLKLF